MGFFFAWVDADETAFTVEHQRYDENVFSIEIAHEEGNFAGLNVVIKNPRVGLLAPGRKVWAWLSWQDDDDIVTPLFFGRLVGLPETMAKELVELTFIARPSDYDDRKRALAETLKVRPYWDPVWIAPDLRDEPDAVLEARPALWHIDRVTHQVTISDMNTGEDGVIDLADDFFYDGIDPKFRQVPGRRARVRAQVAWDQSAVGTVDLTRKLLTVAKARSSGNGQNIDTYTGDGLARDWPEKGDAIGGDWSFGECAVYRGNGLWVPVEVQRTVLNDGRVAKFPSWSFRPLLNVAYHASRSRTETLTFTIEADVQAIVTEAGEEEEIILNFASNELNEPIDAAVITGSTDDTDSTDGTDGTDGFVVAEALRFPGSPDLSSYGVPKIRYVYQSSFRFNADGSPDLVHLANVLIPALKSEGLTHFAIDIERDDWKLTGNDVGTITGSGASATFVPNATFYQRLQWHIDVINTIHAQWASVRVGYYGEIPIRDSLHITGSPADDIERTAVWHSRHDACAPLFAVVNFTMASLYSITSTMDDDITAADVAYPWKPYAVDAVSESHRMAPTIPCYGVIWIERKALPNHTDTWPYEVMYEKLRILHEEAGAEGAVLWSMASGSPAFDPDAPWFQAVAQFVSDIGSGEFSGGTPSGGGLGTDGFVIGGTTPIGDARRTSYFKTDRGAQSLEYCISTARAKLLAKARCIEISLRTNWRNGLALSCRKNMRVQDPRLPGGEATGKIIAYSLTAAHGRLECLVTIGCTVGQGNTVTASPGTPDYVEDGYVEDGYQTTTGRVIMPIAGEVTYDDFSDQPIDDDGVDLFNMTPERVVRTLEIIDGKAEQLAVLKAFHADFNEAVKALNEIFTEIRLDLVPLNTGPFETDFVVTVSDLMVPKTINLEAGS